MDPIQRSELLNLGAYEEVREHFRSRVIEEKKNRRILLGNQISAVFENRDTVLLQIQEMLRTERITAEPAIAHEVETYNALIPKRGELKLTLFVEIPDREEREKMLVALQGLEKHVWLNVGEHRVAFQGEREESVPMPDGRTTAVHYLTARLPDAALSAFADMAQAIPSVEIDHPQYRESRALTPGLRTALAEELRA